MGPRCRTGKARKLRRYIPSRDRLDYITINYTPARQNYLPDHFDHGLITRPELDSYIHPVRTVRTMESSDEPKGGQLLRRGIPLQISILLHHLAHIRTKY